MKNSILKAIIVLSLLLPVMPASGQIIEDNPAELQGIDIEEKLGEKIQLDFVFRDENGADIDFENFFHRGKPVIIQLGYYSCPMLCNLVMNGISESISESKLKFGDDYQVVSVSIDPRETNVLAAAKKKNYLNNVNISETDKGWAFLTADESRSRGLADAVGFKYYYDEEKDIYAHAAVLTVLTEDGVISRYLYGIKYEARDFRLAIMEASEGKIGNTLDRILLYCYHYDPEAGGYVVFAGNIMRIGGFLTLAIFSIFLALLWLKGKRKKMLVRNNDTKNQTGAMNG